MFLSRSNALRLDMAMRQGTGDAKTLGADGEGRLMTFEQQEQPRNNVFGPVSEIGQCAVLDLALVAERFAQENARGRIAVGNRFDIHGDHHTQKLREETRNKLTYYMATFYSQKSPTLSIEALQRAIAGSKFSLVQPTPLPTQLNYPTTRWSEARPR